MDRSAYPGASLGTLLHVAVTAAARHRRRSLMVAAVAALTVGSVVATAGRTDAVRRDLTGRLESTSARLIRVIGRGSELLGTDALDRVAAVTQVQWTIGLGSAGELAWNEADPPGTGRYVGTRTLWDPAVGPPLLGPMQDRDANVGEALIGVQAAAELGLAQGIGGVVDEHGRPISIVGTMEPDPAVADLAAYALVTGGPAEVGITEVRVLARDSASVDPIIEQLPGVLGITDSASWSIGRSDSLLELREGLLSDVESLDAELLVASLFIGTVLLGIIQYGAARDRRREFGIRRALGARQEDVAFLMAAEGVLMCMVGAGVGTLCGTAFVWTVSGSVPDPLLSLSFAVLSTLAALIGMTPATLAAARSDPIAVLRHE